MTMLTRLLTSAKSSGKVYHRAADGEDGVERFIGRIFWNMEMMLGLGSGACTCRFTQTTLLASYVISAVNSV